MKVLKFGGTSVGSAENIAKTVEIIRRSIESDACVVVLSAMSGTTDALIETGKLAECGNESFRERINEIEARHTDTVRELINNSDNEAILTFVSTQITELKNICEGIFLLRELSPRTLDKIMSFGEILSTKIVSAQFNSLGVENTWKDSREIVKTDSNYNNAAVDFARTGKLVTEFFGDETLFRASRSLQAGTLALQSGETSLQSLAIIQGFIASDSEGITTTLGRGGSDYTGAILAAMLDADVLEIWTDVSGMMTADPRVVRNFRQIPHITYQEAMELSHFGAKVIYPPTIQPVLQKKIPILIKNTFAPDEPGTLVESETEDKKDIVRGITSIDKIAILSLEGSGMVGIPGFSKRLFDALSKAKINVILITQSSSEHSICVAIEDKFQDLAKDVVDAEFEFEINAGKIDPLTIENGLSILALVGDNMRNHTGISGKMFSALGAQGVNIRAIAQGSSERNISAMIGSKDVRKAVNTLHEEFFSDNKRQINLYIVGVGTVGKRLLAQLEQQQEFLSDQMNLNVRVVGLANSKTFAFNEEGIDLSNWQSTLVEATQGRSPRVSKGANDTDSTDQDTGKNLANLSDLIIEQNLRNSVFVDVTASPEVVEIYPKLLQKSVSLIACNKIAASSEFQNYKKLKDLAREYSANFLFETNVGAGLPIINTLNDLMRSGDKINRIDAVLSGTLNFVFNNYDGSRPFFEVVRQAQNEGYTEPDPRLDLSGTDVARKILILAREAGFALEMSEIANQGFLPESCMHGSVEDFYSELEKHEAHFRDLLDTAKLQDLTLKYIAILEKGKASVGLQSISKDHNFANLSGKDNAVLFYTNRYADLPLVVKGAGAGADVTAAGVFADIIRASKV